MDRITVTDEQHGMTIEASYVVTESDRLMMWSLSFVPIADFLDNPAAYGARMMVDVIKAASIRQVSFNRLYSKAAQQFRETRGRDAEHWPRRDPDSLVTPPPE